MPSKINKHSHVARTLIRFSSSRMGSKEAISARQIEHGWSKLTGSELYKKVIIWWKINRDSEACKDLDKIWKKFGVSIFRWKIKTWWNMYRGKASTKELEFMCKELIGSEFCDELLNWWNKHEKSKACQQLELWWRECRGEEIASYIKKNCFEPKKTNIFKQCASWFWTLGKSRDIRDGNILNNRRWSAIGIISGIREGP